MKRAAPLTEEAHRARIQEGLGHRFERPELLRDALTHRSFRNEKPKLAPRDNERLEFLGDAVLGAAVAAMLFEASEDAEGELTRRRADLVCEATLAEMARELGVDAALRLGKGEDRTGGREKPRLLASAFEALIGAISVDAGVPTACAVVRRLFAPRLDDAGGPRDHKSTLQEKVQALHGRPPRYRLVRSEGEVVDHDE